MKKIITKISFLIIVLLIVASCNENTTKGKMEKVRSNDIIVEPKKTFMIDFKYEDLYNIVRFNSVSCSQFESFSSKDIKNKRLNSKEVKDFKYFFKETLDRKKFSRSIDVKARMLLFNSDDSVIKICFDAGNMMYDNNIFLISDEFREYLLKLTETDM